jgi:ribosomal protein L44E
MGEGMANRQLSDEELAHANGLLGEIRKRLDELSEGDEELLFAYRRKIYKELTYDERGKPIQRKKLKDQKRAEQDNRCAVCGESLPEKYVVLDRFRAAAGYTRENTRVIHQGCDAQVQKSRGYA